MHFDQIFVLFFSGINMRYLGQVLKTIQDIPQLQYLKVT
jgi:hypothetical protein